MKQITRDKTFKKHYKKRIAPSSKLSKQFDDRVQAFVRGERAQPLNDHALTVSKQGLRAFSISGDIRVIYKETADAYIFLDVGSHNQVY
jgi:addiction module RelE/StbE family toxin